MQIYKKNPKLKNINLGINSFYIYYVALPLTNGKATRTQPN